ncbi:MAG: class I SAM-dependent methyltransferase [Synergistaceae bacterium]|jgi:SAM-dependent methyltransferase|nr:class I SAM-dependent methyltransferase [Synergistaceae bacterium]
MIWGLTMNLSRDFTLKIHFILDQLLPPLLRDSRFLMRWPLKIMFSAKAEEIMDFKETLPLMSPEEYVAVYETTAPYHMSRKTDLNSRCTQSILQDIAGSSVLEVGCGRGFLTQKIKEAGYDVTATDIVLSEQLNDLDSAIKFLNADISALPFADNTFDTVICTHVLEHVVDFKKAVSELRRVVKKRLIIVVPRQRPYRYTFDLHLRFFPYLHSFLLEMIPLRKDSFYCADIGGDIYYREEMGHD